VQLVPKKPFNTDDQHADIRCSGSRCAREEQEYEYRNEHPVRAIEDFVIGLCAIPEEHFRPGSVYEYLTGHPVDESLSDGTFFSARTTTRGI
jgi:hypothetical protein